MRSSVRLRSSSRKAAARASVSSPSGPGHQHSGRASQPSQEATSGGNCSNSFPLGVPSSHAAHRRSVARASTATRGIAAAAPPRPSPASNSRAVSSARRRGELMTRSEARTAAPAGPPRARRTCSVPASVSALSGTCTSASSTLCPACACRTKATQRGADGTSSGERKSLRGSTAADGPILERCSLARSRARRQSRLSAP
mmetsp:Transcript_121573/g.339294  ORF Transcript_121573/g.339294 Transcript_121573/m.339294 type:complete len:200 (-) Transcript_121573:210-809(-)